MKTTVRATQIVSQNRDYYNSYTGVRIALLKNGLYGIYAINTKGPDILIGQYRSAEHAKSICNEIINAVTDGKRSYWMPMSTY